HILVFITKRHPVREGILTRHPTGVYAGTRVNRRPRIVKRLVAKGVNHLSQLLLRTVKGHLRYETNYSWHISSIRSRRGWTSSIVILRVVSRGSRIKSWSRREELNAPSAEYDSAA